MPHLPNILRRLNMILVLQYTRILPIEATVNDNLVRLLCHPSQLSEFHHLTSEREMLLRMLDGELLCTP